MDSIIIENTTVVNLTPHELNLHMEDGSILTIPTSGIVARLKEERVRTISPFVGVKTEIATYGKPYVTNGDGDELKFPEAHESRIYIVSGMMLSHFEHRHDVYSPGTAVRDDNGRIIGCNGLSWNYQPARPVDKSVTTTHDIQAPSDVKEIEALADLFNADITWADSGFPAYVTWRVKETFTRQEVEGVIHEARNMGIYEGKVEGANWESKDEVAASIIQRLVPELMG